MLTELSGGEGSMRERDLAVLWSCPWARHQSFPQQVWSLAVGPGSRVSLALSRAACVRRPLPGDLVLGCHWGSCGASVHGKSSQKG